MITKLFQKKNKEEYLNNFTTIMRTEFSSKYLYLNISKTIKF